MVNIVRARSPVGVPLMLPSAVLNVNPLGRFGLMDQVTTAPEPETVGESGRSLLTVLLVISRSSGV